MFEIEGRMFGSYVGGLPHFILYFVVAIALLAIFVTVYFRLTAHDELRLIRDGNLAAVLALGGSMVGFVLPLSKSVAQATSIPDMLIWGFAAFIVQILSYLVCRILVPGLSEKIDNGQAATGLLIATVAISAGLLNAASMSL
ncbi:COG3766 Predicted membrane protein [Rhabdaerophilaceae bacterium]